MRAVQRSEETEAFWERPRFSLREVVVALMVTAAIFYALGFVTTVTVNVG